MPTYFFDTVEGAVLFHDDEGIELPGSDEAEAMARHALADLAKEKLLENNLEPLIIEVRDREDGPLARYVLTPKRTALNGT
ncbi:DUF6894 family protein [Pararhizobium haloflavum]|uniref:DUF6894 family protein n=1 Tax=Pararhizobium haloflavum TaxID=2037914 RepID=UPI000C17D168|nr:hypothetical protein [Pararhizobium haloflavum]